MKKLKYVASLLIIPALATGCGKVPKLENGKEAVVTIGKGEDISVDDLYSEMKEKYALSVLLDMIDSQILNKSYKTDDEVKEYIKGQIEQLKYYYESYYNNQYASFEEMLKQAYGVDSEDELKDLLALDYKRGLATDDYIADNLSDKEIKNYYDSDIVGDIRVSHILIKADYEDGADEETIENAKKEAREKAEDLIKKLEKIDKKNLKKEFAELAKKNSDDEGSASKGGDVDFFNKGEMDSSFEKASYDLKVGEYTKEPVESAYGYHIILKTDEKEKESLDKVKDKVIDALVEEKKKDDSKAQAKALVALRKKYKVNIEDSFLKNQYKTYIENSTK